MKKTTAIQKRKKKTNTNTTLTLDKYKYKYKYKYKDKPNLQDKYKKTQIQTQRETLTLYGLRNAIVQKTHLQGFSMSFRVRVRVGLRFRLGSRVRVKG